MQCTYQHLFFVKPKRKEVAFLFRLLFDTELEFLLNVKLRCLIIVIDATSNLIADGVQSAVIKFSCCCLMLLMMMLLDFEGVCTFVLLLLQLLSEWLSSHRTHIVTVALRAYRRKLNRLFAKGLHYNY